ncbi:Poly(3-hydroxybutyrate) depolymerase [Lachnospiraceae bacterium]|nr:Poly(3-hydroxybutyrate) depolymerase [Lachnospiraceae bacterium]
MKKIIYLTLMLIGLTAACILMGCSSSGSSDPKIENVVLEKDNKYTCTFEDVKHDFVISLPQESKNAPLIVMLHGAGDSAENFRLTSGFDNDALPKGYAVCYVSGTVNAKAGRNYSSWNYGRLEPDYNDVGFIKALVNYLVDEYSLDEDHVFCAGFSNGGFMNFRLALEAQDTFLACTSVGGDLCKTLWKERPEKNDVGMLVVFGDNDESIPKNFDGSAKTALDPAIEDVIDYMASSNGLEKQSEDEIGNGSIISKYGADSDKDIVWGVLVKDAKHAWYTEEINGISTNKLILEFFENWR